MTPQDRDRITRFRVSFNSVEHAIKKRVGEGRAKLFELIQSLKIAHPEWKYGDDLRVLANLRNEIAHADGTDALRAVPTERAIEELGRIRRSIDWLDTIGQRFCRKVECVSTDTTLREVLRLIRQRDYSQFPVLTGPRVIGLLTENGITRWLAENAGDLCTADHFDKVRAGALLKGDENRAAYEIVPVSLTVEAAVQKMGASPALEALLIRDARSEPRLRGIVTRWDIVQVSGQLR